MNREFYEQSKANDKLCALPYLREKYEGSAIEKTWAITDEKMKGWDFAGIDFYCDDPYPCCCEKYVERKTTYYDSKYKRSPDIWFVVRKYYPDGELCEIKTDFYFYVYRNTAFLLNRQKTLDWIKACGKPIQQRVDGGMKKEIAVITPNEVKTRLFPTYCRDFIEKYGTQLAGFDSFAEF